jgi:hypothetical protein
MTESLSLPPPPLSGSSSIPISLRRSVHASVCMREREQWKYFGTLAEIVRYLEKIFRYQMEIVRYLAEIVRYLAEIVRHLAEIVRY